MLNRIKSLVLPAAAIAILAIGLAIGGNPFAGLTGAPYVVQAEAGECIAGNNGCNMCMYPEQDCAGNWYCPITQLPPVFSCDPPPTQPSCADSGQLGTYPNCYTPSCADSGQQGTYPNCYTPTPPSCADSGQLGTYPYCYTPTPEPTCADYPGHIGTYPYCFTPTSCSSAANSCGMTNTGTTIDYYGTCSATTPAESLCVAYSQAAYYAQGTYYSQSSYYAQGTYAPGCTSPTVSIKATPSRVKSGQTTTLTVTASGITGTCTVTGPGVSRTFSASSCNVSGTITTPAITQRSTYSVTCDGGTANAKIIVNMPFGVLEF